MRMCKKGLHDLDAPGVLVKNGSKRAGTCGPCKAERQKIWAGSGTRSRRRSQDKDKLVCDYGHIFTIRNTRFQVNDAGHMIRRHCRRCVAERILVGRGQLPPRVKASPAIMAAQQLLAEAMDPSMLATFPATEHEDEVYGDYDPPGFWVNQAACRGVDPELFFPEDPRNQLDLRRARKVCVDCPVWKDCRDYAIRRDEVHGIWGGLSRPERVAEAERRRLALVS